MHFSAVQNTKIIKYSRRKERLNMKFVWTKEAVQNFLTLNSELEKLQVKLEQQMRSVYELFTKLEKSGMAFLHGFKVLGQIDFEKAILNELYELDKPAREQTKLIERWENLQFCSNNVIKAWQLVFDSETADFFPLSKIRLKQKGKCWNFDLPMYGNIDLCSFLENLIDYDTAFSLEDLAELTIKDFEPVVKVVLNYNTSELEPFFNGFIFSFHNRISVSVIEIRFVKQEPRHKKIENRP